MNDAPAESGPAEDSIVIEVCVGGINDVLLAASYGVHRIELNSGVALGGLTPSTGLLKLSRQVFKGPVISMIRPREGGFCYSANEFDQMLADAEAMADNGSDGLATGFLTADGTVDRTRCKEFRRRFPDVTLVFHRAFDVLEDLHVGLRQLADLGWDRILTSGGCPNALCGAGRLKELDAAAAGRVEILPGGGIRPDNVQQLLAETGLRQIHSGLSMRKTDPSTSRNPSLQFGGSRFSPNDPANQPSTVPPDSGTSENGGDYTCVSEELLIELMSKVSGTQHLNSVTSGSRIRKNSVRPS